ncbi:MAG: TIGR02281 family clan AA aspartic protease [Rhodospirillales bacterium]|nr:TIGR02281 family clan AA aspartic protease [Rhodospirillales bacterium]MDP6804550.1 TIGR02281 family clan AA aspartic protease [Rhodospirillales bacterium]
MASFRSRWPWFLAVGLVLTLLLALLWRRFPEALGAREERASLVHGLLLLVFVGGAVVLHPRFRAKRALAATLVWLGVGALLFVTYTYRFDFESIGKRLLSELVPGLGVVEDGEISFRASAGGHFVVEAEVDGVTLRLLVDTGASDVVLSPADARRLGFALESLSFTKRYRTANGVVFGAPVRLNRVRIGPISVSGVAASVNGAPMTRSLLGMSFLDRLSGYEVRNGTLVLRP